MKIKMFELMMILTVFFLGFISGHRWREDKTTLSITFDEPLVIPPGKSITFGIEIDADQLGPSLNVVNPKNQIDTVLAPTPVPENIFGYESVEPWRDAGSPIPSLSSGDNWMNAGVYQEGDTKEAPIIVDPDGRVFLSKESILAIAKTVQIMDTLKMKHNNYLFMWEDPYGYKDGMVDMLLDDYERVTKRQEEESK